MTVKEEIICVTTMRLKWFETFKLKLYMHSYGMWDSLDTFTFCMEVWLNILNMVKENSLLTWKHKWST